MVTYENSKSPRINRRNEIREDLIIKQNEGRVWFTQDLGVVTDEIIQPGYLETIPITIPDDLPLTAKDFFYLSAHTRSRFAQIGLELFSNAGRFLSETYNDFDRTALVQVANLSKRPILLPEGIRFFNLYFRPAEFLGENIILGLFGNQIAIEGERGKEWNWWRGKSGEIIGLELFLDPQYVMYIPESDQPLSIHDGSCINHNRAEVDRYLEPVPDYLQEQSLLWVGQIRSKLSLGPAVHAQIDNFV